MKKVLYLAVVSLMAFSFILSGCADKNNSSTTNISGNNLAAGASIKGTVQGYILDASTNQPIAGAVVDIGVAQATTTADGQFVLRDVPATEADISSIPEAGGGTQTVTTDYFQSYYVTINLKGVTSPVSMGSTAATPRYPDFKFGRLDVHYETISNVISATTGSVAGTFIVNVQDVSTQNFEVGKLAANVNGVVAGCRGTEFFTPVAAGYTVYAYANNDSLNSSTGTGSNIVASATTDANGAFTFSNLESGTNFWICASNAGQTVFGCADGNPATAPTAPNFTPGSPNMEAVTTPFDGQTKILAIQQSNAVHVCPTDIHGPAVVLVTPEPGMDITPGTGTQVKFKFSEAVLQTAANSTLVSGVNNLYDKIEVAYNGAKAGNLAYTLNWNTAFDELTVTFDTAPSGKYYVRIADIDAAGYLTDAVLNVAAMGKCPDDTAAVAAIGAPLVALAGTNDCTAYFTTNAGPTPTAPTVAILNSASLNNAATSPTAGTPSLDWPAAAGANKGYNVYRRTVQNFSGGSTQVGPYQRLVTGAAGVAAPVTTITSAFVDDTGTDGINTTAAPQDLPFTLGSQIKLTYDYAVTSINSDGVESAFSTIVNAADTVGPRLINAAAIQASITPALALPADGATTTHTIVLTFNEDMDEALIEAAVFTTGKPAAAAATDIVPAVSAVGQYNVAARTIQLTMTLTNPVGGAETYSGNWALLVPATVKDVSGVVMNTTFDEYNNNGAGSIQ